MADLKLRNKIALVTGGNSGIGLASAKLLAKEGATVIIVGRNKDTLALAQKEILGESLIIQADMNHLSEIEAVVSKVRQEFGSIDILYLNAGVSHCPPILETTEKDYNFIFDINVKSSFFTFTRMLPLLADGASVIFTSSAAHDLGRPGDPLYSASKAAVRSLVRTLAADENVLPRKIRVNAVSPGAIKTPLTKQDSLEAEATIDSYIESTFPMGRWGQPEEIAKAVLFLACSDSSYMTGAELAVDGGLAQI